MLSTITNITMSNSNAVAYLDRVCLEETLLSSARIRVILKAAILRYLGGVTSMKFLIDLTEKLRTFENITEDKDLLETITLLAHLGHKASFKNIDQKDIATSLQNILKKL